MFKQRRIPRIFLIGFENVSDGRCNEKHSNIILNDTSFEKIKENLNITSIHTNNKKAIAQSDLLRRFYELNKEMNHSIVENIFQKHYKHPIVKYMKTLIDLSNKQNEIINYESVARILFIEVDDQYSRWKCFLKASLENIEKLNLETNLMENDFIFIKDRGLWKYKDGEFIKVENIGNTKVNFFDLYGNVTIQNLGQKYSREDLLVWYKIGTSVKGELPPLPSKNNTQTYTSLADLVQIDVETHVDQNPELESEINKIMETLLADPEDEDDL